uniref:hypothetical protein n=1 Tax=Flavobacterium sp. TaxID=239 RepID=UPI0040496F47
MQQNASNLKNSFLFLIIIFISCKNEVKDFKETSNKISKSSEFKNLCIYLEEFNSDKLSIEIYRNYTVIEHSKNEDNLELKEHYLKTFKTLFKTNLKFNILYIQKKGRNIFITEMDVERNYTILKTKEIELLVMKKYRNYIFYNLNDSIHLRETHNYICKVNDSIYFINEIR